MTKRAALMLAGLALSAAAVAADAATTPGAAQTTKVMPREQTLQRSVEAGKELRVFTYARWSKTCEPQDPPGIEILTPPAHGTASLRPGSSTVRHLREGDPDCTGHVIPGLAVWYVPAPGFHGTDKFDYQIIGLGSVWHDTVFVEVRYAITLFTRVWICVFPRYDVSRRETHLLTYPWELHPRVRRQSATEVRGGAR